jgi:serine protease
MTESFPKKRCNMFIQKMKQNKLVIGAVVSTLAAAMTSGQCFALPADSGLETGGAEATYQMVMSTNRIIVKYRDESTGLMTAAEAMDRAETTSYIAETSLHYLHQIAGNADVLALDGPVTAEELQAIADRISADPDVLYAEPDLIMHAYAVPDDPRYDEQWHYFEAAGGINLPDALDISTGNDVTVAVIDSGIIPHADLNGQILPGYDFITNPNVALDGDGRDTDPTDEGAWWQPGTCGAKDPGRKSSWHGTHVAGTVAAKTNNGIGVAGVAWNAKILPVRVLGRCGGRTSDIAEAMRWAAGLAVPGVPQNPNPAKVINLSLGGKGLCGDTYREAIEAIRAAGVTVVVAAGNNNTDAIQFSPGNCPGVITVAANNRDGGRAYYSNFGTTIDITAPGGETSTPEQGILSTLNSGSTTVGSDSYQFYQGTSMAAPHVAGVVALMYALDANLTSDEVLSILTKTARSFPVVSERQCDTTVCGAGILDAYAAVNEIDKVTPKPGSNLLENGRSVNELNADQDGIILFRMEVPAGATDLKFLMTGGSGDADIYVKFGKAPTIEEYDYRPYLVGNKEFVEVETVQSGTYYIALHGYEPFSGVSLIGWYQGGGSTPKPKPKPGTPVKTFANENDVQILDGNFNGVLSNIIVPRTGDAGVITVNIDIKHGSRGDLYIRLIAPNGANAVIKEIDFLDSQSDFQTTVRFNANGIEASGQWSLHVIDASFGNTGYIDRWSITFE